jgi:Uma2 family endonuclease
MTAEPTHAMWSPDPRKQRLAAYTLEDVLKLPYDAPRVELRDGVAVVVPTPSIGHQQIGNLLWLWLREHSPEEFESVTAVGVAFGYQDTLEPDVLLIRRPVALDNHFVTPERTVLAVEVVSPGTKRRDRLEKPAEYAAAGVPHFWRIEQNPIHIFAYALGKTGYELVADATEELVLMEPFEIRLPIRDITP